jgi:inner membrane protein
VQRIERDPRRLIVFPRSASIEGRMQPSVRKLGLHQVRVYELQSVQEARFDVNLPPLPTHGRRNWALPYLSFGIADVRGLVGTPTLTVDGKPVALVQGLGGHREGGGLHAELPAVGEASHLAYSLKFQSALGGTESLAVVPLADSNHVRLESSWPHPRFGGSFLPRQHREDASGFSGEWDLSSLAAGSQQQYRGQEKVLDALSVSMVDPVNIYSQADRASKYGILFVMLTFVAFFMVELLKVLRIHAIQYTLVGLALAIFFLLLLGLSEHMEFWIAYLISSIACIGLLGTYLASVLRSGKRGFGFACALSLLYAALSGLLVSEDNALVLGALMLFAILAALMLVTRRVDWYSPSLEGQERAG